MVTVLRDRDLRTPDFGLLNVRIICVIRLSLGVAIGLRTGDFGMRKCPICTRYLSDFRHRVARGVSNVSVYINVIRRRQENLSAFDNGRARSRSSNSRFRPVKRPIYMRYPSESWRGGWSSNWRFRNAQMPDLYSLSFGF